jgi:hypothetical protein
MRTPEAQTLWWGPEGHSEPPATIAVKGQPPQDLLLQRAVPRPRRSHKLRVQIVVQPQVEALHRRVDIAPKRCRVDAHQVVNQAPKQHHLVTGCIRLLSLCIAGASSRGSLTHALAAGVPRTGLASRLGVRLGRGAQTFQVAALLAGRAG